MNSRTYENIDGQTAERFYKEAVSDGWTSTPASVDFAGYSGTVVLDNPKFAKIGVDYNLAKQTATVTIMATNGPGWLEDSLIFDFIGGRLSQAEALIGSPGIRRLSSADLLAKGKFRSYIKYLRDLPPQPEDFGSLGAPKAKPLQIEQVATAYDFPESILKIANAPIVGVIELGGGYQTSDLAMARADLPARVKPVPINRSDNSPGEDEDADGEVNLDIQIIGKINPHALQNVYFTTNDDAGIVAAIKQCATDRVCCVSFSWGGPEPDWDNIDGMNAALQELQTLQIPFFVASGDNLGTDGAPNDPLRVDFPASSPYVIGCGGTQLTVGSDGKIVRQVVWNNGNDGGGTGGGLSQLFKTPQAPGLSYRMTGEPSGHPLTVRGVPDCAANGDPISGYQIVLNGEWITVGGTSAVAPLMAGLYSILIGLGYTPNGDLKDAMYANQHAFSDVTAGNNGNPSIGEVRGYAAGPGWDACTGLGSPIGPEFAKLMKAPA